MNTNTAFRKKISHPNEPSCATAKLLNSLAPLFPSDATLHKDGSYSLTPQEQDDLNTLFIQFGLTARVTDTRFSDISELAQFWFRFANNFGRYIRYAVSAPALFDALTADWPASYKQYIEAVLHGDMPTANKLAIALQVENLHSHLPFRVL